jgi:AcrR family transcriptional regulator
MIDAARDLFVERGLDAVSLADIVRVSGGSLSTLYELFESKEGLLAAILGEYRAEGLAIIDSIVAGGGSPAATLAALAEALHNEYARGATMGLMRLAIAESLRNPQFAHNMFETAHLPIVDRLTRLFDQWQQEGRARIPDAHLAAELFLGLLIHSVQTRAFFGEPNCLPLLQREATIRDATALFVAGYQLEK